MVAPMDTQCYRLLRFMEEEPNRVWYAKDFQGGSRFIGYEAGPRMCDLCDKGFVERVGRSGKYMGYKLRVPDEVLQDEFYEKNEV